MKLDDRYFDIRAVYIGHWNVVFGNSLRHFGHLDVEVLRGVAVVVEVDVLWICVLQSPERQKPVIIAREILLLNHFNVSFITREGS